MRKTEWKRYSSGGERFRIRVEYGLRTIGEQAPYFSITGEIQRQARNNRWVDDCAGCIHEEIEKRFASLRPLIKWHLCSVEEPMHYLANSKYHLGFGKYSKRNLEHFKSTCVFGALPTDSEFDFEDEEWPVIGTWLKERLPALQDAFKSELAEHGIL